MSEFNPEQDNDSRQPRISFPVVMFVLPVMYPLSIGPYVWYKARTLGPTVEPDWTFYQPLLWIVYRLPPQFLDVLYRYMDLFVF